jgi:hypothetical protein
MNERIQQLAEKCEGRTICECGEIGFNYEKFAELIVRECIGIAQDRAAFDWATPNDVNHIISEIKEHFGVEE